MSIASGSNHGDPRLNPVTRLEGEHRALSLSRRKSPLGNREREGSRGLAQVAPHFGDVFFGRHVLDDVRERLAQRSLLVVSFAMREV